MIYIICMGKRHLVGTMGNARVYVIQDDHNPPHVHVIAPGMAVRVEIRTGEVMDDQTNFNEPTVNRICKYVVLNQNEYLRVWEEINGKKRD